MFYKTYMSRSEKDVISVDIDFCRHLLEWDRHVAHRHEEIREVRARKIEEAQRVIVIIEAAMDGRGV